MEKHRCVLPQKIRIESLDPPFSCFERAEAAFGRNPAIHRCFSLARSFNAKTLVTEDIEAKGLIESENNELSELDPNFNPGWIKRISFWRTSFHRERKLSKLNSDNLVGYAILKRDVIPGKKVRYDGWHVFEAVFRKYDHKHNCVPCPGLYNLQVGSVRFAITGVLYGQQNSLNKACAHVALRSLLSRFLPGKDVSYAEINETAQLHSTGEYHPKGGLSVQQMRAVLKKYGVAFRDVDYDEAAKTNPDVRKTQPYQKYLYAGIESGIGGLLGFSMSGPMADTSRHIVPFYGHTFNKDTWVPEAEQAYFNIGGGVGYIPSESWTSSFLGHDDNFGPNFCIPRLYVRPEKVSYVVELMQTNAKYSGVIAEARALQFIYSLYPYLTKENPWSRRLVELAHPKKQRVILRALCVHRAVYLKHLTSIRDWEENQEQPELVQFWKTALPDILWVVEVSIPHLFPANERKVGEIVLNAMIAPDNTKTEQDIDYGLFLFARLPAEYYVLKTVNQTGPIFSKIASRITSHVEVLQQTKD